MRLPGYRGIIAGALLAGCAAAPHRPTAQSLDELLAPIAGSGPYLQSAAGHVVLLDVWASWCRTCDLALTTDAQLQHDLASQGLVVLTVDVDADPRQTEEFLRSLNLREPVPVLRDPEGRQAETGFRISRVPTAFVIDRRGRVRRVESGYSRRAEALRGALELLLQELR